MEGARRKVEGLVKEVRRKMKGKVAEGRREQEPPQAKALLQLTSQSGESRR